MLGAVTDDGDSFYCWTEENLTRFYGIRLLEALTDKFGKELVVFLDRAGYFYAKDLWEHVSGERETETVGSDSREVMEITVISTVNWTHPLHRVVRRVLE